MDDRYVVPAEARAVEYGITAATTSLSKDKLCHVGVARDPEGFKQGLTSAKSALDAYAETAYMPIRLIPAILQEM
jgi:hypothetical protein